jgi:hypothetical protein
MKLNHPKLVDLLQKGYSAEKAAAFAYQGHAASIKDETEKKEIHRIENDEWFHRKEVLEIMNDFEIPISKVYEIRFHIIGKVISYSCHIIGRFMPFYFAGNLESGNVCEYFRMKQYFNSLGITKYDQLLYDLGIKEKEHEIYFLEKIKTNPLLPFFEKFFGWGINSKMNNIDLENKYPFDKSESYCKN